MHTSVTQDVTNVVQTATSGMIVGVAAVKFAKLAGTTNTNYTVVAAVTGKKIRVLAYALTGETGQIVTFTSGAGGTALTGSLIVSAGTTLSASCQFGLFETAAGAALAFTAATADKISGGHVTYIEL